MDIWLAVNEEAAIQIGYIPDMVSGADSRTAIEQLNANYAHGGGWRPFKGFKLDPRDHSLHYDGDPKLEFIAAAQIHDDMVIVYPHSWVAVVHPDDSFEVCRMD